MEEFSCWFSHHKKFYELSGTIPKIYNLLKKKFLKHPEGTWGKLVSKKDQSVKVQCFGHSDLRYFETLIPEGMYCYTYAPEYVRCPFWSIRANKGHQNNGFCHYMGQGDWQENGTLLLWDQCKECGINNEWEADEYM